MGRSDARPPGRSDAERGVGRAGVLRAHAKPRGAGRGVWVGAGVPRGVWWADGLPSQALPSSLGAGSGQGERGHISHRNIVLVPLLETPQGNTKIPSCSFRAVLFTPNAPEYSQRTSFNM